MREKHILVIDDDPSIRDLIQALLENFGYTSDTAENGREAVAKLSQAYDAIVLDYFMPDITGLTVLGHIRRTYPDIPVVMLTGHTEGQVAVQALAAGARTCLYKPFDCQELKEVLNGLVGTVESEQLAST